MKLPHRTPAATGPADAATNGMGGAGGNGPQGALTPTAATASAAPTGGIGDSGGGPSAPPIWKNPFEDILPQGPLTGAPGGAPAGNTSANTQQSRASSAQAGPLAQINQGSVTPSETASWTDRDGFRGTALRHRRDVSSTEDDGSEPTPTREF